MNNIVSLGTIPEAKEYFKAREQALSQAEELFALGIFGFAITLILYAAFLWTGMVF